MVQALRFLFYPLGDRMTRVPVATPGQKPPYKENRLAWFWFLYDWETREKTVLENDQISPDVLHATHPPNTHLYKIQVELPARFLARELKM